MERVSREESWEGALSSSSPCSLVPGSHCICFSVVCSPWGLLWFPFPPYHPFCWFSAGARVLNRRQICNILSPTETQNSQQLPMFPESNSNPLSWCQRLPNSGFHLLSLHIMLLVLWLLWTLHTWLKTPCPWKRLCSVSIHLSALSSSVFFLILSSSCWSVVRSSSGLHPTTWLDLP